MRVFRKIERKFSSEQEKVARESLKLFLAASQYVLVSISLATFMDGNVTIAAIVFSMAVYLEKILVKILEAIDERVLSSYISDHYSALSRLPSVIEPAVTKGAHQIKEEIAELSRTLTR